MVSLKSTPRSKLKLNIFFLIYVVGVPLMRSHRGSRAVALPAFSQIRP